MNKIKIVLLGLSAPLAIREYAGLNNFTINQEGTTPFFELWILPPKNSREF